jgi:rhodanese-related sulfurtransferase
VNDEVRITISEIGTLGEYRWYEKTTVIDGIQTISRRWTFGKSESNNFGYSRNVGIMDFNIGGMFHPTKCDRTDEISDYEQIILACSNGFRSGIVARMLTKNSQTQIHEEGMF